MSTKQIPRQEVGKIKQKTKIDDDSSKRLVRFERLVTPSGLGLLEMSLQLLKKSSTIWVGRKIGHQFAIKMAGGEV